MFIRYYVIIFLNVIVLTACDNSSTNSTSGQSKETQSSTILKKEAIDNNFNDYVNKFSSDSIFQLRRTKFPLKIKWYDVENDKDSLIYKVRTSYKMIDFRKKNLKDSMTNGSKKL
jgi:hypothetical protein